MADLQVSSSDWKVESARTRLSRGTLGSPDSRAGFPREFLTTDSEGRRRADGDAPGNDAWARRRSRSARHFVRPASRRDRRAGRPPSLRGADVPSPRSGDDSQAGRAVASPLRGSGALGQGPAATRGPAAQAIKAFLIKVAEKSVDGIASLVLSKLVAQFERRPGSAEGSGRDGSRSRRTLLPPGSSKREGRARPTDRSCSSTAPSRTRHPRTERSPSRPSSNAFAASMAIASTPSTTSL